MAQSQSTDNEFSLKNYLQVSFKGISFTADDVNPARLLLKDENGNHSENLSLLTYSQETPLSYTFNFTQDVSLTFTVSGTDSTAALSISANLPPDATGLHLNYKPTSGFSVTDRTASKLILNSKNLSYAFTAAQINDNDILFSAKNLNSYYVAYDPSVEFSYLSVDSDMIIAQKATYETNIKNFRENIVTSITQSIKTNQPLNEKAIIAFVAEEASRGRYKHAINLIPDSFKKGNKRTYLSAPYFNSLDAMYPTLEMHIGNMAEIISNAGENDSLSIFTVEGIAEYMDIHSDSSKIRELLSLPNKILQTEGELPLKLSQASGILCTYLRLSSLHSSLAEILNPVIPKCLEVIESCCSLSDTILTLSENDLAVSDFIALSTGNALIQWGEFNGAQEYCQTGYAIINSILSINSLDLLTIADIYPVLIKNDFYPHFKVLTRASGRLIWAWTCSPSITYSEQNNEATIAINFPKGEINHAYIQGIRPFTEIEIYGLSFHSDPRFESYNSSGFIFKDNKNVLLLKSRHKSETEIIKLIYR